jgi:transcriptional regulator with XRE-family HTH domain
MRTDAVCTTRTCYASGVARLAVHHPSQPMTLLSDNLTARRDSLGLSVPQVHAALNARGIDVAFSTVAGWFNGSRGVRKMEHLKALCAVLQTDLNSLGKDEIEVAEGPVDSTVIRELRDLAPAQREAVLAVIRTMKGGAI